MEKSYLESLNAEQYEAATTIDGLVLIIAGAGTGKTHTLTARVMHMLQSGIEGKHILLVTFTNKAADEMKARIVKKTGKAADEVTACTFHSFCAQILRAYIPYLQNTVIWQALFDANIPSEISLQRDFRILTNVEQKDIMNLMRKEWMDDQNKIRVKKKLGKLSSKDTLTTAELLELWSRYTNETIIRYKKLGTFIRENYMEKDTAEEALAVLRKYISYKAMRNMIDYDDLLMFAWVALASFKTIRERMDDRFMYIMCDEYQDTNMIQDAILDLMSRKNRNLCVCGDDNQSIYRFRGARIENILSFSERYPDSKTVKLVQNYRSTQEILDVSNSMMHHANEGITKDLIGQSHGIKPDITCVQDDMEAADIIIKDILKAHKEGKPYHSFGVLERQGKQSATLESKMNLLHIPYKKYGGIKFFELSVVRDLIAYMQVLSNPKDELAYLRIAKQFPELGNKRGSQFADIAIKSTLDELRVTYSKGKAVYQRSVLQILDLLSLLRNMPYEEIMPFLFKDYEERQTLLISTSNSDKKKELLDNLRSGIEDASPLLDMAAKFSNCGAFIESIALDQVNEIEDDDYVSISTVHSAKGLEYENVYLLDTSDHYYSRNEEGSEEDNEDLRVLYVALTRAKKNLHILINMFAPYYAKDEQFLTRHLVHEDVLACAEVDANVPLPGANNSDGDLFAEGMRRLA